MTDKELLQEALESIEWLRIHLERDHGCLHMKPAVSGITDWLNKTEAALCARLAQLEQEPVWVEVTTNTGDKFILDPAVEAEKIRAAKNVGLSVVPLYPAPPQREWVGLTDDEKHGAIWTGGEFGDGVLWAEKLLKERNT